VLDGYREDEHETQELQRSVWLPTGDLRMLDEEGYFYIRGRKKRVIKSGGMSVQADEVEQVLQARSLTSVWPSDSARLRRNHPPRRIRRASKGCQVLLG
jgi:acyl-CoA synthetase (AMP-forming)/AMP-acid ligase II